MEQIRIQLGEDGAPEAISRGIVPPEALTQLTQEGYRLSTNDPDYRHEPDPVARSVLMQARAEEALEQYTGKPTPKEAPSILDKIKGHFQDWAPPFSQEARDRAAALEADRNKRLGLKPLSEALKQGEEKPATPSQRPLTVEDAAIPSLAAPAAVPAGAAVPGAPGEGGSGGVPSFKPAAPSAGEKKISQAFDKLQEAAAARASLEATQAAAEEARKTEEIKAAEAREAERLQKEEIRKKGAETQEAKLRSRMDELERVSKEKIDPDRWWKSRSSGQKVLAGISAFLSGFGGGPDYVMEAIRNDLALQREDLDRKTASAEGTLRNEQTLTAYMRQRFQDERVADAAAEVAAINLAKGRNEILLAHAQGDEAKQRGVEMRAKLDLELQNALMDFRQKAGDLALKRQELELRRTQIATEALKARQKASGLALAGPEADPATLTPEQRKRLIPGIGEALDDDSAKKGRELKTGYEKISGLLQKMIKLRDSYGPETFNRTAVRTGRALRSQALLSIKNLEQTGALDKGTVEVMEPLLPEDPLEWKAGTGKVLEEALDSFTSGYTDAMFNFTGRRVGAPSFQPRERPQ
jgi:hypothetical protein